MSYAALISRSDFADVVPALPDGMLDERIDPVVRRTQELDILPRLGAALYYDVMSSPTDADYLKLLNGGVYQNSDSQNIYFAGLKKSIVLFSYARLIEENRYTLTSFGFNQKLAPWGKPVEGSDLAGSIAASRTAALEYFKQAENFMLAFPLIFDLYPGCKTTRTGSGSVRINAIDKNKTT